MISKRVPVSVCIPTYNGGQYIGQCLESIISQSFANLEILIVDDCSTDNSFELIQEYALRDSRIKYIRNPKNLGLVENWNRCIELSSGEWIKFVFQDDIIKPNCVEKMYNHGKMVNKEIIICRREIVFEKLTDEIKNDFKKYLRDVSIESIFKGKTEIQPYEFCRAVVNNLWVNFIGEPTAVMIHREIFKRFGNFDNELRQLCDFEFWCRVGCNVGIAYVNQKLAIFRLHPGATSVKNRKLSEYKPKIIDRLYINYLYATNPLYKNLRDAAIKNNPPENLELLSILNHLREEIIIKGASICFRNENFSPAIELKTYFNSYPHARVPKKLNWIKLLIPFILSKKLMNYMYRYLLMRLVIFRNLTL
jgi:glycosyltransferase involved in cell wall biosynthesis